MIQLPEMPAPIRSLPRDARGFPVPWFVHWEGDKPMFHVADDRKLRDAIVHSLCWVCGEKLGRNRAFVIGPMCSVNRVSAEPPMHRDCAEFSVRACPFLSKPKMGRMDAPEGTHEGPGLMIKRNPGVSLLWVTRKYDIERHDGGCLFRLGEPEWLAWYAEGRAATRAEVMASIESGLPLLASVADEQGPDARAELDAMVGSAMNYVPVAEVA